MSRGMNKQTSKFIQWNTTQQHKRINWPLSVSDPSCKVTTTSVLILKQAKQKPQTNKKTWFSNTLKSNDFYWVPSESWGCGANNHPEIWSTGKYKESKMCLSGTEATGAINWQEHLNGKFDELFTGQM